MSYREALNFLHPLANYEGYSRNYARAWEICCPNMWPHKPKSKSHRYQKSFVYLRRREETLRTSVYWPCIISVHQESWLQRWTLLRTVLWIGKIKGIIRVRCVETSMLHLHVSIKGVTKISPPPSPTTTTTMAMRDEVRGEVVRLMICSYAKLQESHCIFTDKRNLYKHRYRDTPTPPPKLGSNLPPPPHAT